MTHPTQPWNRSRWDASAELPELNNGGFGEC